MSDSAIASRDDSSRYSAAATALMAARQLELSSEAWYARKLARRAVLDCAPAAPTPWWPGGWVLSAPDLLADHRSQAERLVWRTETEALGDLPSDVSPELWTLRWTPVDRERQRTGSDSDWSREPLPFDELFWQDGACRKQLRLFSAADVDYSRLAEWVGTAVAGGVLGNAAYDAVKAAARKLTKARADDAAVNDPPLTSPSTGQGTFRKDALRTLEIDIPPAAPPVIDADTIDP